MSIRDFIDSKIINQLNSDAERIVMGARSKAKTDKISSAISFESATKSSDGIFSIHIAVNLRKDTGAPEARAYEYGSGIHATRGPVGKYIIAPRNAAALAFKWPGHDAPWGSRKFIGITSDGRYLFRYVEHPGVEADPFLEPAIREVISSFRSRIVGVLSKGIRDSIIETSFQEENL